MTALRFEDADADELRRRIDDALMDLHFARGAAINRADVLAVERISAAIETLKDGAPGIEAALVTVGVAAWKAAHPDDEDGGG